MRRAIIFFLAALISGQQSIVSTWAQPSPAPPPQQSISYSGGDGSSIEQAVVINGAVDSSSEIRAEYAWLAQRFPDYKRQAQSLVRHGQRMYDRLEIQTADGHSRQIYFAVTDFFGKLR